MIIRKTIAPMLLVIVFFALISYIGYYGIIKPSQRLGESNKEYKSKLGEEFVFNNDTLLIIDYSFFGETFTLSNGITINKNLVLNSKTK